ncbi:hypothetical protein [Sandarakinorhabdus sp.]|uniref:hypothetical protein n=1 Tax=Sandarakinorhabdus sp. TaxID=1916663 RepID=UPI0038F61BBB
MAQDSQSVNKKPRVFRYLRLRTSRGRKSGEGGRLGNHFAGEGQALTAFWFAAQLRKGCARAIAATGTRRVADVTFFQSVADTDEHGSLESRIDVARRYQRFVAAMQVVRNSI